ncbi:MAG TPA: FG-GAP-like repeat-containing protein, partial [Flavitalea sp.]|nr:FG-GAP-like repeat-containing protein [Flavitalea sp.]
DGDGKQDILVVNSGSNTVSVLRNISNLRAPAFETASVETGRGAMAVSLGDLDGDGRLEMIVTSGEPGKIGIYKNLSIAGKIEFGQVAYFQTGISPTDVACGDLDGDGKPDLAIANGYSVVTIVRNTFGEPVVTPSGTSPVYGAITQQSIYDSTVNTYQGQPYVQRHFEVTPVNNPNTATGTIKLFFRQTDFDAFNAHPDHGLNLPMGPSDSAGIANLRVYQYHGTSSEGTPGTYNGSTVVIDPDDSRIVWNPETEWWDVSFDVQGFSGFFVSVKGNGMNVPSTITDDKLRVYPNPAYGRVVVKHPVSDAAFIRIIDMRGNVVRVIPLKNDASQSEINIHGLPSGIYKIVWRNVNSMHVKTLMVK